MTALMKDVYDQFLDKALEGRKKAGKKMTREELVKLAGGRIWTGRQAKENGLIDELGTLRRRHRRRSRRWPTCPPTRSRNCFMLPKSKGFLDTLIEEMGGSRAPAMQLGRVLRHVPRIATQAAWAGRPVAAARRAGMADAAVSDRD